MKPFLGEVQLAESIESELKPQFETPKPVGGVAEPAATDAAALLSLATGTPFEVERYRQAYMERGLVTEWQGLEDMWRMSYPGTSRRRLEKMIEGKSLRLGINFKPVTDEEVNKAVANFAQTKDDAMMAEVAERLASEPPHPDASRNEIELREVVSNSLEEFLVAEKHGNRAMKDAVDAAYINMDTDYKHLISGMFAQVFLPTDIPASGSLRNKLLDEEGLLKNASMANNMQVIRDAIATATPEEKEKMAGRLNEWMKNNTGLITDWQIAGMLGQLDNGKLLEYGDPDDKLGYALSVLSDVADYFYAFRPLKLLSMMGQGVHRVLPRTVRLTNAVNRRRSGSIMRGLLEGAQGNDTLKKWGISTEELAATQLPKPSVGSVSNLPGNVLADVPRISALRDEVSALDAATRAPIFNQEELLTATAKQADAIEKSWGPKLRVNLSTIKFTDDRAGVDFGLVLGYDDLSGFADLKQALRHANKLDDTGTKTTIMKVEPNGEVIPYISGKEFFRMDTMPTIKGEFFIKLNQRYDLHPMDKLLFDDNSVLAPTWLGSSMKWLLPQTSILNPSVANKYISNFMTESAIQDALGSIVSPLFKELGPAQRAKVGEMWSWTEEFGRTMNRVPTWDELRAHHLDVSDKELLGWWRLKQFYDTAYALNNRRLQRDWNSRGFKTLYKGDVRYHGKPLTVPEARRNVSDGWVTVFDPERGKAVAIKNKDLERLYERGMSIIELDRPITSANRNYHTLVLSRPHLGWSLKNLDDNVLKYIPGYYPRIYEDPYYIKRAVKSARINGKLQDYEDTVAVASSDKEAQAFVDRITATRGDDSERYFIASDARLRTRDATAADLDQMRTEGRLFFDDRNQTPLFNVNGNPAEIVDPINAVNRTARMLARAMSTEDLVRAQKQAWKSTYGEGIKGIHVDTDTSVVVGDKLDELIKTAPKAERKRLIQARAMWDHIRLIEGSSGEGATWFRGASIKSAEFLHNLPLVGRNPVTQGLMRNAHKVAPVEWMKNLAFFDFLVTRPGRQLILQGAQHLFLAPLAPGYMGKWQLDSYSALQGLKRLGLAKGGLKDISEAQSARNAFLMGLKRDEYDLLIEEIRRSGIVQTVNVHSYAGDLPRKIQSTRYSAVGRFAEGAVHYGTLRPLRRGLEKYGFELGEQYNMVASYMMSLRLYRDANQIKNLGDISKDGWREISAQASNYGLAMHRANSAAYQYGLLSLPLQFLQFTHKVFLTYMRGIPGLSSIGNKSFTPAQARKILLGQLVMFGGSGFGIRPEIEEWLNSQGFEGIPDSVKDLISGGAVDWMLDKLVQNATNDPDLNWAFGDWLAPGGNMVNLVREMVQTISEQPAIVTLLGPSYVTASRFSEGVIVAKEIWSHQLFEESTPEQRAVYATEAVMAGLMSGYNDFMKARLAMKMGFWATQSGHQTEIEAKFGQAIVKAGLGLNPEQLMEANALKYDTIDELKKLDEVAQESYNRMYRITALFGDKGDREKFLNDIRQEQALLQILEPHEIQYVWRKWQEIERDNPTREPMADVIAKAIGQGYSGDELRARVQSTKALDHDEETRRQLLELLDRAAQDLDWTNERVRQQTEDQIENVRELTKDEEK